MESIYRKLPAEITLVKRRLGKFQIWHTLLKSCARRLAKGRSFLDALFYSDSVSAIGHHADGEQIKAVVVGWEADEESNLDKRMRADGDGRD